MSERVRDQPNQLVVYLPPEVEEQIYQQMLVTAIKAIDDAQTQSGLINKPYLNRSEVRELLSIGDDTLDDLIIKKGLKSRKVGRQRLFKLEEIIEVIDNL